MWNWRDSSLIRGNLFLGFTFLHFYSSVLEQNYFLEGELTVESNLVWKWWPGEVVLILLVVVAACFPFTSIFKLWYNCTGRCGGNTVSCFFNPSADSGRTLSSYSEKEREGMEEPRTQWLSLVKNPHFIIRNLKLSRWIWKLFTIWGNVG